MVTKNNMTFNYVFQDETKKEVDAVNKLVKENIKKVEDKLSAQENICCFTFGGFYWAMQQINGIFIS